MSENDQKIMSEREMRLAAEMGKPVNAKIQNKILEDAKRKTRERVEELKAQQEEEKRIQEERERIANVPPMSKRQKILYEQQKVNEERIVNTSNIQPVIYPNTEYVADKENNTTNLFKPFAITQPKIKVTELPSHFLSYPKDAEVYITPYTGDDIDELSNSKLSLRYVLTKAMEGIYTNFDKNKLTLFDVAYLSFYRRCQSALAANENQIQVVSACPYCGKFSTTIIDINDKIEFDDVKFPTLPINVEFSFGRLSFSYLTYEAWMNLKTELKSEELAAQCITECEIDEKAGETKIGQLQKLFGSLVGQDKALLDKVRELTYHGAKPIKTLCQNKDCGETYDTYLDEMNALVLPFRTSSEDIRAKVSFG